MAVHQVQDEVRCATCKRPDSKKKADLRFFRRGRCAVCNGELVPDPNAEKKD